MLDFEAPLALRFSVRVLLDLGSWARAAVSEISPEVFGELTVGICCVLMSLTMAKSNPTVLDILAYAIGIKD